MLPYLNNYLNQLHNKNYSKDTIFNYERDLKTLEGKGKKERFVYLTPRAHMHLKRYLEKRTDDSPRFLFLLGERRKMSLKSV